MGTVIRVSVVFFFVLIVMRIIGKRDVAQLSPFELVMLMLIPDIAQNGMMREDHSITNALIGLGTLFTLAFLNGVLTFLSPRAEKVVQGEPSVLYANGEFIGKNLDRERVTLPEIYASMRKAGYANLDDVKWVILEAEGGLSFVPKDGAGNGGSGDAGPSPAI